MACAKTMSHQYRVDWNGIVMKTSDVTGVLNRECVGVQWIHLDLFPSFVRGYFWTGSGSGRTRRRLPIFSKKRVPLARPTLAHRPPGKDWFTIRAVDGLVHNLLRALDRTRGG
jgi:hypothetical protein